MSEQRPVRKLSPELRKKLDVGFTGIVAFLALSPLLIAGAVTAFYLGAPTALILSIALPIAGALLVSVAATTSYCFGLFDKFRNRGNNPGGSAPPTHSSSHNTMLQLRRVTFSLNEKIQLGQMIDQIFEKMGNPDIEKHDIDTCKTGLSKLLDQGAISLENAKSELDTLLKDDKAYDLMNDALDRLYDICGVEAVKLLATQHLSQNSHGFAYAGPDGIDEHPAHAMAPANTKVH